MTPHLDRFVQSKVDSGGYQSVSEVVREGLRLLEQREHHRKHTARSLCQDIEIGWQQLERGQVVDGEQVFEEIRQLSKARRQGLMSKVRYQLSAAAGWTC